jgi:CBS domain-containing protein
MTTPVEARGVPVPMDFDTDVFAHVTVARVMERCPGTVSVTMKVATLADRIGSNDPEVCHHTALLVTGEDGGLVGIITRRDLLAAVERGESEEQLGAVMTRRLICAYPDEALHEAVERMHTHDVGRLPVVSRTNPSQLLGYLGRAAVLSARRLRWQDNHQIEPGWFRRSPDEDRADDLKRRE